MLFSIKWLVDGMSREAFTRDRVAAEEIANAMATYWHGDVGRVKVWQGDKVVYVGKP